ncbi:hypothetical protein FHX64_000908 [Microbacter margulisiae]|uniref:Uncharacterized protein n=1 Tax=Microbacter margulisiae TaxID=1350067 RepID=A0A7W5DPL5_9PORP|nr:hypothetical protein [Microbacter margulisiae]
MKMEEGEENPMNVNRNNQNFMVSFFFGCYLLNSAFLFLRNFLYLY